MNKHYLWEKLGLTIQRALGSDEIHEIILNPDGKLWLLHAARGMIQQGVMIPEMAATIVHALAEWHNQFLNEDRPYLDCCLPFNGERVNVTIPPVSDNISFNIRKKSKRVFTLREYLNSGAITAHHCDVLINAITQRKNILVSGGPGSGKTTFTNALLHELSVVAPWGHRVLILEQVPELQCGMANHKRLLTSTTVDMRGLLWIAMRNSPDRIMVGEVRDGAALEMLKAWNTGCPGGMATMHANSPKAALQRVLDLSLEVVSTPPYILAAEAINLVVQIAADPKHPAGRKVTEIIEVTGFDNQRTDFIYHQLA